MFSDHGRYRILTDGKGWQVHLSSEAPAGWVVPGQNPNGLYCYVEDVDDIAGRVPDLLRRRPDAQVLGHVRVSVSDPDGTLVQIGWPSRLMD